MRHGSHTGHEGPGHGVRTAHLLLAPALAVLLLGAGTGGSGETVSLDGDRPGERLDVTLTRVVDPAGPEPARAGADRLVAVELRLENTGTAPYADSPAPAAHLLDSTGRRFTGLSTATDAGPALPAAVTLAPGGSATGYVVFRLPAEARPAAVQFALDAGLGDDVAHWSLS
ncbi:DUF4352 domain-containing protein [Streptomyces sp. NPDC058157]|uniref:DUF4352 domain-containing protein n=1 Tax=Streptomyces sp. NPDC058157 TaxID=3346360 RepID=UPI0036EC0B33